VEDWQFTALAIHLEFVEGSDSLGHCFHRQFALVQQRDSTDGLLSAITILDSQLRVIAPVSDLKPANRLLAPIKDFDQPLGVSFAMNNWCGDVALRCITFHWPTLVQLLAQCQLWLARVFVSGW
jgi:hypothetical protein